MTISRRDFINGFGLAIASGLTPAAQIAAQPQRYPPALTGLRGEHDGSFEVAHAFAHGNNQGLAGDNARNYGFRANEILHLQASLRARSCLNSETIAEP